MVSNTFRLFKKLPSAVLGMMLAIDLGATTNIYNISETTEKADYEAIHSDWMAVGCDMKGALSRNEANL